MMLKFILYEKVLLNTDNEDIKKIMDEVSHQWRQPLCEINSIVFAIDNLLEENGIKNSEIEEKLSKIENITQHMSQTIDDIREQKIIKISSFTLANLLADIKDLISTRLDDNSIKLLINIDEMICVKTDNRILFQAINNIINNAIDILLERNIFDAKIQIEALEEENEVIIKVIDNAGGITRTMMKKIFDEDYTTKHTSQGSGIGLHMVKIMIEEHLKAKLLVYNVDYGVCFEIRLNKEDKNEV